MKKEIAIFAGCVAFAAYWCKSILEDKTEDATLIKAMKVAKDVRDARTAEDQKVFDDVDKLTIEAEELEDSVKAKADEWMEGYEKANQIEEKVSAIRKAQKEEVEDFKKNIIKVEQTMDDIQKEERRAVSDYMKETDYTKKIDDCNAAIKNAERQYETQKTFIKLSGDNEQAKAVKEAAKAAKKKIVKENEKKIEELKKGLNEVKVSAHNDRLKAEQKLRADVTKGVGDINSKYDAKYNEIYDPMYKKRAEVEERLWSEFDDKDKKVFDDLDDAKKKVRIVLDKEDAEIKKRVDSIDKRVALGEYLAKKGYNKFFVAAVYYIPVVAVWSIIVWVLKGFVESTIEYVKDKNVIISAM